MKRIFIISLAFLTFISVSFSQKLDISLFNDFTPGVDGTNILNLTTTDNNVYISILVGETEYGNSGILNEQIWEINPTENTTTNLGTFEDVKKLYTINNEVYAITDKRFDGLSIHKLDKTTKQFNKISEYVKIEPYSTTEFQNSYIQNDWIIMNCISRFQKSDAEYTSALFNTKNNQLYLGYGTPYITDTAIVTTRDLVNNLEGYNPTKVYLYNYLHFVNLLTKKISTSNYEKVTWYIGEKKYEPYKPRIIENLNCIKNEIYCTYNDTLCKFKDNRFIKISNGTNFFNDTTSIIEANQKKYFVFNNQLYQVTDTIATSIYEYPSNGFQIKNINEKIISYHSSQPGFRITNTDNNQTIQTGNFSISNLSNFITKDSLMYFPAFTPTESTELWSLNLINNNTKLVKDINPGNLESNPNKFKLFNNQIIFVATSNQETNLWVIDSTNNVNIIKDLDIVNNTKNFNLFTPFQNNLLFIVSKPSTGLEINQISNSK